MHHDPHKTAINCTKNYKNTLRYAYAKLDKPYTKTNPCGSEVNCKGLWQGSPKLMMRVVFER